MVRSLHGFFPPTSRGHQGRVSFPARIFSSNFNPDSILCGFIPAIEANLLLEGKKEGTYLIRCSKTQPGSFAVTFVDNTQKIKHCLLYSVLPYGLTLKSPPNVYPSLRDFLEVHVSKLKHPLGNKWTAKMKLPNFSFGEQNLELRILYKMMTSFVQDRSATLRYIT